jgi:hypothetical protein
LYFLIGKEFTNSSNTVSTAAVSVRERPTSLKTNAIGYINETSAATAITPISNLENSIHTPLPRPSNNSSAPTSGSTIKSFTEVEQDI